MINSLPTTTDQLRVERESLLRRLQGAFGRFDTAWNDYHGHIAELRRYRDMMEMLNRSGLGVV